MKKAYEQPAPLMQVQKLSFAYQQEMILQKISFSIYPGDFVALIGTNGAGKSTLMRILLGELSAHSGQVTLFGTPVEAFHNWPAIGYVPQGGGALAEGFPATVEEVVGMGMYAAYKAWRGGKERKQRIMDALTAVEMQAFAGHMIGKLSGGQVQRVLIARALAGKSRMLLLDEPTTGVDTATTIALYQLLQTLNREQALTVLMVTHDIARAMPYTTRTLCLEQGSVVELEKDQIAHELAHRHQHP